MANLIVRKDKIDSEVAYGYNGSNYIVKLKEATQEQLAILEKIGIDVFEKPAKKA